jgi:hypothetical protein
MVKMRSRCCGSMPIPLVTDGEDPVWSNAFGRDMHGGWRVAVELQRVGDQVLEQLVKLNRIGHDGRQRLAGDHGGALVDGRREVGQDLVHHVGGIGPL